MHAAKRSPWCRLCEPPAPTSDKRGRNKALTFAVLIGTSVTDSQPVKFSGDPENWSYMRSTSKTPLKRFISCFTRLYARAAVASLRVWSLARVVHDSSDTEDSDTPVGNTSFDGVTHQQWDPSVPQIPTDQVPPHIATILDGSQISLRSSYSCEG